MSTSGCRRRTNSVSTQTQGPYSIRVAGHNDWIYSVAFSPATKKLATGSWDGEIRLWNADDAKGLVTFTAAPGYTPPTATAAAK